MPAPPLRRSLLAVLAFCTALWLQASAQDTSSGRIEEILRSINRGHFIRQVAISPDGRRLAWITQGAIHVAPVTDLDKSVRVSSGALPGESCTEDDLAWSPDSAALAFFSDCGDPGGQTDLYLTRFDSNPPRRLTQLHGYVDSPAFSPDGASIAFLYVEGGTRPAGALAAMKPFAGVIGEDGVEVQRIAIVPANAPQPAAPVLVSPANLHAYEFDWSPDSKSLAYIAAEPPGENNWWVAKLYTQLLGAPPAPILSPADVPSPLHGLQIAVPRWSPDGKSIAFIGGLMSDQGATGGDVWIVPSAGGTPRDLTERRPTTPTWIEWGDDEHIFISELAGGVSQFVPMRIQGDPAAGDVRSTFGAPVFSIPGQVGDGRFSGSLSSTKNDSEFVFSESTFDRPGEIYAVTAGPKTASAAQDVKQLSHINSAVEPAWGKSVSLEWSSDSLHVQGWLMLPRNYEPTKKYPLIVLVHGGPAAAVVSRWGAGGGFSANAFSALGYFVLQPNPRGSYGQGEAFTQANRKDFGYGDLRDILAGVDAVEAKYPIDPKRVGLTGWSYGGFMTMFAITQTGRFQAAVAGAGISDWLSYYGENSIDQWMIPYFGASVYDDPAVYAKSSAIDYIKQAHTPTLVVVGDRDGECPAPQSFEFWHALRDLHVPTQLVVYPNEGHGFVDPEHQRDVLFRAAEWFAQYMPPGS